MNRDNQTVTSEGQPNVTASQLLATMEQRFEETVRIVADLRDRLQTAEGRIAKLEQLAPKVFGPPPKWTHQQILDVRAKNARPHDL